MTEEHHTLRRSATTTEMVRRELEGRIRKGVLRPGEQLPNEPELAAQLGVSRNSLREALQVLEDAGLIIKRHGIGTFVTESSPLVRAGIERLTSLTEFVADQGRTPGSRLVSFDIAAADSEVRKKLGLAGTNQVAIVQTIKTADAQPVAVCFDYVPTMFLKEPIDPQSLAVSIFEGLENEHCISIRLAECEIIPTLADNTIADMLDSEPGAPVLLLSQVHLDTQGRRVCYSRSYFPATKFTFRLVRRR